jgi:hypothetical protein
LAVEKDKIYNNSLFYSNFVPTILNQNNKNNGVFRKKTVLKTTSQFFSNFSATRIVYKMAIPFDIVQEIVDRSIHPYLKGCRMLNYFLILL